jgi:hypothetical protein
VDQNKKRKQSPRMRRRDCNLPLKKTRKRNKLEDWAKHRYFRNRVTNKIKVDKDSYSKCLIEQNSGYPNLFWKTVKKILPGERKEMPSRIWIEENISSDMNTIANAFNIFFATLLINI